MATASLVLGIIALVSAFTSGPFSFVCFICSVLGIIFGAIGKSRAREEGNDANRKLATAGLICSIIGLCFGILMVLFLVGMATTFLGCLFALFA